MNIKTLAIIGAVVLSELGLAGAVAYAQSTMANPMSLTINSTGSAKLVGTVSAINGQTVSVASWGGTWSVNTANASFLPPNSASLAEVKVGDTVAVQGTITSGMSLNAFRVVDRSVHSVALSANEDTETDNGNGNSHAGLHLGLLMGLFGKR